MRLILLTILSAGLAVVGMLHLPPRAERPHRVSRLLQQSPPEVAVLENRLRVKNQLARRIIAERTPLLEAVEWFHQVNGEEGIEALRTAPGRSVREKLCRQVIRFVASVEEDLESEGYSPNVPLVSAELRAEFDRMLAAGELPPDPETK